MSEIIIEDGCSIIRVNLSCDGKFPLMIGDPNRDFVFPHYLFFGEVTGKPDVVPSIDITMHSYVRTDILSKELQQLIRNELKSTMEIDNESNKPCQ